MSKQKNVEKIIKAGLCTGCGTCKAVCPKQSIRMKEMPNGLLSAVVDNITCNDCGVCLQVCGGWHLAEGLIPADIDPFKGKVLAAYRGYANDPEIRLKGQSGGVATALLACLLESGQIDQALVNRMPEDGSLRPEPFLASNKDDLMQSQGSKYCPVALNASIPGTIGKTGNKLALVGLPCHFHSLRNAQQFQKHWKNGVNIAIGLFCDSILIYSAMDYLIKKGKIKRRQVLSLRYKDKTHGAFPGSICIFNKDHKTVHLPSKERVAIKSFFTPPRCKICFDKTNILSDISLGDAWGVKESKEGYSVIIARTSRGLAIIEEAQKNGYLSLTEINPEKIFKGQGIETRRKQWTAFNKIKASSNESLPDFHIDSKFNANEISDVEGFVIKEYQWGKNNLEKKTSKQIIRMIQLEDFIKKVKWKFNSLLSKLK